MRRREVITLIGSAVTVPFVRVPIAASAGARTHAVEALRYSGERRPCLLLA